jgi:hypothetical protein
MTHGGNSTVNDKTRWIKPQVTTLSYNVPFSNLTRSNQIDFISHGDVGSGTTFTDSSINNLTLTSANGASHAGTGPFGGSAMSFVRASSQQVSSASTSLCNFGTSDFTIDFWFNINSGTATSTRMHALNIGAGNSTNISFDFNDSGYGIWVYWMSGGSNNIRQSGNYRNDGLWHHCAFVRDNGTCRLWIDGAYIGGVSYATQIGATQSLYIGSSSGGQYWDGYIDEVRIIKGTALWRGASDFSVPTSRGKNASLLDVSSNNNNGSLINGTGTSTTHYRYGQVIMPLTSAYLEFDGTDDYIDLGTTAGNFGTDPFTVSVWLNFDALGSFYNKYAADQDQILFSYSSGKPYFIYNAPNGTDYGYTVSNTSLATGTWYNLVATVDRSSNFPVIYVNGVNDGSSVQDSAGSPTTANMDNTGNLIIGRGLYSGNYSYFNGKMAQLLVYKGKALTPAEVLSNYNTTKSRFS